MAAETTLREITKETVRLITALDVRPDQHGLVARRVPGRVEQRQLVGEGVAVGRQIQHAECLEGRNGRFHPGEAPGLLGERLPIDLMDEVAGPGKRGRRCPASPRRFQPT